MRKRLFLNMAISGWLSLCFAGIPGEAKALEVLYSTRTIRYQALPPQGFNSLLPQTTIPLFAAKNETVAFQLVIKGDEKPSQALHLIHAPFSGPGALASKNMTSFSLRQCQEDHAPDCLIPLADTRTLDFRRPNATQVLWIDIFIPKKTPPGIYKGAVHLMHKTKIMRRIPLTLQVHAFSLPDRPSLKIDLNNYGLSFLKKLGYPIGTDAAYAYERRLYRFVRKHRMIFNPLPYKSQRGRPHATMAPELVGKGEAIRVKDWRAYDQRYGPLFSGALFDNKIPLEHQYLPFNPEWPSAFSNYFQDREKYEIEWRAIAAEFRQHFREKGWDQTVFQIFMNQKPRKNNRIPWNLDEPKGKKDYRALRYYADLTHRAFDNDMRYPFRIDISHFYCEKHRGHPDKDFEANHGAKILSPVDVWVISKHSMDDPLPQKKAQALKKQGKTVFEYMAGPRMPLIQEPLMKAVQYGWHAWLRDIDGLVFWSTIKNKTQASDGRDFLIYPQAGEMNPALVASIRLKAIRRGAQDYEYFQLASKKGNLDALIKQYLSDEGTDDIALRKQMVKMIMTQQQ